MLLLTIRTDKPEAEIGLYEDDKQLAYQIWQAHRQLAETLHRRIDELLRQQHKELKQLQGIVCYKGPGSFTGLRIGLTAGNALAYGMRIAIVAADGNDWQARGIARLLDGGNDRLALPEYGADVHITLPKR